MSKKRLLTYIAATLVVIAAALFCFASCDGKNKRAAVIIPDAFASAMWDTTTGEVLWDPVDKHVDFLSLARGNVGVGDVFEGLGDEKDVLLEQFVKALAYVDDSLTYRLSVNDDGTLVDDTIAPIPPFESEITCGVFNMYGSLTRGVREQVGKDVDVFVFNWDWRKSPLDEAKRLQSYLNGKGYSSNILISHGQGSALVNCYLALDERNRKRTVCNVELAPTTLGSFDALALLVCPDQYFERALADIDVAEFGIPLISDKETLLKMISNFFANRRGNFLYNNPTLISMLPSIQLLRSDQYANTAMGGLIRDDKPIGTAAELYNFYATRPFAFKTQEKDGVYDRIPEGNGYAVKDAAAKIEAYHNAMFVGGKIASESVRSYYIVSSGISTVTRISCAQAVDENGVYKTDKYGDPIYEYRTVSLDDAGGDGNAPLYSFSGGTRAQMNAIASEGRVIDLRNVSHILLGIDWDVLSSYIIAILSTL